MGRVTRTGYHGVRVNGQEPGRFEEAGLIVTSWLQGTSRDGDPQDHVHNQIARITRTTRDGKWRPHDTASLRAVLGALQAIAATTVECKLTAEFGVDWIPRADGRGNEIVGVTQAQLDAYSTRTVAVQEKERELARAWQRRHGRAPTSRELLHISASTAPSPPVTTGATTSGADRRRSLNPYLAPPSRSTIYRTRPSRPLAVVHGVLAKNPAAAVVA